MSTSHECPKCGKPMEHQEDDPEVGVVGGWVCTNNNCGHTVGDWEYGDDDDDWRYGNDEGDRPL